MKDPLAWSITAISRPQLMAAIKALEAPATVIAALNKPPIPERTLPDKAESLAIFRHTTALPEDRQALAEKLRALEYTAFSAAYLQELAIRADLLRLEGMKPLQAQALALAGVLGVRDIQRLENPGQMETAQEIYLRHREEAAWEEQERLKTLGEDVVSRLFNAYVQKASTLYPAILSDTAVILVVKGAGVQKPDETLNEFVKGFWPAVKTIDPQAKINQRQDIYPSGFKSAPHDKDPHNHVTEIRSGERRVWVKEVNWEPEIMPASPFRTLNKEWKMATYALGSWVWKLFFGRDTSLREKRWQDYFKSNFLVNWTVAFPVILMIWIRYNIGYVQTGSFNAGTLWILIWCLAAAVGALPRAFESYSHLAMVTQFRETQKDTFKALPGMPAWLLGLLVVTIIFNLGYYLLLLFGLLMVQLALLNARATAWRYRQIANSDTDTTMFYTLKSDTRLPKKIYRRDRLGVRLAQLLYRYIVVLGLPLVFILLTIARLMKWTRILGAIGNAIEQGLSLVLSSVLGDVVTYAMDPTQAHRIRSAVEGDIRFFHEHPQVSAIHIFAHSQGTPITFETVFNHLPEVHRQKIETYLTIGSVLSYYNQANPILDPVYVPRFPVRPYPSYIEGFKWINFWNLVDPITEFYGLDEYNYITEAPEVEDPAHLPPLEEAKEHIKRHPISPVNIKTNANTRHHSEYWGNQDKVQIPLARRVLGDPRPPEWAPEDVPQKIPQTWGRVHHFFNRLVRRKTGFHSFYVYSIWARNLIFEVILVVALAGLAALFLRFLYPSIAAFVTTNFASLNSEYTRLFPPDEQNPSMLTTWLRTGQSILEFWRSPAAHGTRQILDFGANIFLLAWALTDGLTLLLRKANLKVLEALQFKGVLGMLLLLLVTVIGGTVVVLAIGGALVGAARLVTGIVGPLAG